MSDDPFTRCRVCSRPKTHCLDRLFRKNENFREFWCNGDMSDMRPVELRTLEKHKFRLIHRCSESAYFRRGPLMPNMEANCGQCGQCLDPSGVWARVPATTKALVEL